MHSTVNVGKVSLNGFYVLSELHFLYDYINIKIMIIRISVCSEIMCSLK